MKIWTIEICVNFDLATPGEDQIRAASILPNLWAAYLETVDQSYDQNSN